MSAIDEFLDGLDAPARAAFERIITVAREAAPDAEDGIGYGMPALRYRGKGLLGFRVAAKHLSVFPFSAGPVEALAGRLAGFGVSKGTIRFAAEKPLPDDVVRELVALRMQEIDAA